MPCIAIAASPFDRQGSGQFSTSSTTALGELAASLSAGEWGQLTTINLVPTLGQTNLLNGNITTGNDTSYSDSLAWDSTGQLALFVGQDHYTTPPHIARLSIYDASSNTWSNGDYQSWMGTITHGYDHNAVDPARRDFYYMMYNSRVLRQYDIATASWSEKASAPVSVFPIFTITSALAWFPERDTLIAFSHRYLGEYDPDTNSWSALYTVADNPAQQNYHTIMEYNPVHNVVLFGGGGYLPRKLFKLDATGTVTQLADAPIDIFIGGETNNLVVDPVSGDYLYITNANVFYKYDITVDEWTLLSSAGLPARWNTIAAPIDTYGVIMFVTLNGTSTGTVWVYKHAE